MHPNPKPKPPLPGGEYIHVSDPGTPLLPPGVKRYNLIPAGDGGPGSPIPPLSRKVRKPLLPSEAEVASLPKWARVAFAARCAKRVLPVIERERTWVERAIRSVEQCAAIGGCASDEAKAHIRLESNVASELNRIASTAAEQGNLVFCAVDAVRETVEAACFASVGLARVSDLVYRVEECAVQVVLAKATDSSDLKCFRRDFERFAYLAEREKWTDDTPVSPEVIGKLWPTGRTPEWATQTPK